MDVLQCLVGRAFFFFLQPTGFSQTKQNISAATVWISQVNVLPAKDP